jgi:hypothetical protein
MTESKKTNKGQYFSVPISHVKRIVKNMGRADDLYAFIVLCRGAGSRETSSWTERAISEYLNIPYARAKKACARLVEIGIIKPHVSRKGDKSSPQARMPKWEICDRKYQSPADSPTSEAENRLIYLPNQIVDGNKHGEKRLPLASLSDESLPEILNNISFDDARLDALVILILFYDHHDLSSCGGVDPNLCRQAWRFAPDGEGLAEANTVTPIGNSGFSLLEIIRNKNFGEFIISKFLINQFIHVKNKTSQTKRVKLALKNVYDQGLVYEVLQIWDKDPIKKARAELVYPLYLFDASARDSNEPSLARAINKLAFEVHGDSDSLFTHEGKLSIGGYRKTFRYIAPNSNPLHAMSSLRLRYRAHEHDTGVGIDAQKRKVKYWESRIES